MPLAEHDCSDDVCCRLNGVSIHVPLAEHDRIRQRIAEEMQVSIHVPLAEHDHLCLSGAHLHKVSIHVPLAEHDFRQVLQQKGHLCFNSRAPRGARRDKPAHAEPLGEFQFTCPSRSTTEVLCAPTAVNGVSIHVPLAEHD